MGAKNIQIFAGTVNDPGDLFPVYNIKDSENQLHQLDEFRNNFHGTFTAFLRIDSNQARKSGERVVFTTYPDETINGDKSTRVNHHGHVDVDALRKQWESEQAAKDRERKLLDEFAALQQEIRDMRKPEAKLMSIFEKMVEHFQWDFVKPKHRAQPIQGTTIEGQQHETTTTTTTMGQFNMDDLNDADATQVEDAFAVIYSHMGKDLLIRVAQAIERDPGLVKKLDLFI